MSTTERAAESSARAESRPTSGEASARETTATEQTGSSPAVTADDAQPQPTAESMREGAMARVAPRSDLSARRVGAARSAGMAGGSAAGASAGRKNATGARQGGSAGQGAKPRRTGPRRVRLTVNRLDPWSVFKISLLLSVALGIATVIMVGVLWTVLSGMNVFATVNEFIVQVTSGEDTASSFDLMDYIGLRRVLALSTVFAVINVVLLTALATLGAFLYNVCAALVGGTHLTLSDE